MRDRLGRSDSGVTADLDAIRDGGTAGNDPAEVSELRDELEVYRQQAERVAEAIDSALLALEGPHPDVDMARDELDRVREGMVDGE